MMKIPSSVLVILAVLSVPASAEQSWFNRGELQDEIEAETDRNRELREAREGEFNARRAAAEAGRREFAARQREAEARQRAEQAHETVRNEIRLRREAEADALRAREEAARARSSAEAEVETTRDSADAEVQEAREEAARARSSAETKVETARSSAEAEVLRAYLFAVGFAIAWAGLMALVVRVVTANAREEAGKAKAAAADERRRTKKAVAAAKGRTRTEASKAHKAATAELRAKLKAAEQEATVARTAERRLTDRNEGLKQRVLELERLPGHHSRTEVVAHMLGLATPVTRQAINTAKRQVAKTFHPDVCRGPLATRIMQFLNPELDSLERNL